LKGSEMGRKGVECGEDGDTIRAIAEMNRMTGGYEPERHELEIIVTIGGARTVE
jgi:hypothetical protein